MKVIAFTGDALEAICYLAYDEKKLLGIIIDAPKGTAKKAKAFIDKNRITITHFINTHGHWDHIANNAYMKKFTGKHCCHKEDSYWLKEPYVWAAPFTITPTIPDLFLSNLYEIKVGDMDFTILHTPGHTEGSICIFEKHNKVLFSGDTLFKGACGRTDLMHGDPAKMKKSLTQLAKLPPETIVYPGHGSATTMGEEASSFK